MGHIIKFLDNPLQFLPESLQFLDHLLRVPVPHGVGRVGLSALGTLFQLRPALGTDQVLLNTTEDPSSGNLQADWALQVRLLLSNGLLLLLNRLLQEADKSLIICLFRIILLFLLWSINPRTILQLSCHWRTERRSSRC